MQENQYFCKNILHHFKRAPIHSPLLLVLNTHAEALLFPRWGILGNICTYIYGCIFIRHLTIFMGGAPVPADEVRHPPKCYTPTFTIVLSGVNYIMQLLH